MLKSSPETKSSPGIYAFGLVLACGINLLLFALIPHSSMEPSAQPVVDKHQTVYFDPEPHLPQPEDPAREITRQPPTPHAPPTPQAQITPAPAFNTPQPSFSLPQTTPRPRMQMDTPRTTALRSTPQIFAPSDLDVRPRLSRQKSPQYPLQARRRGLSGYVKIQFDVLPDGEVRRLRILESEPPGVFDRAVLDAVKTWEYQPGEVLGDRVRTRMVEKIVFNLEDEQ
jgi:protein TonB